MIRLLSQGELGLSLAKPGLIAWGLKGENQNICVSTIGPIAPQFCPKTRPYYGTLG